MASAMDCREDREVFYKRLSLGIMSNSEARHMMKENPAYIRQYLDEKRYLSGVGKEIKEVKKSYAALIKTTGKSSEALPYDDVNDTKLLKQNTIIGKGPLLSEKRLKAWRITERKLERFLKQCKQPQPVIPRWRPQEGYSSDSEEEPEIKEKPASTKRNPLVRPHTAPTAIKRPYIHQAKLRAKQNQQSEKDGSTSTIIDLLEKTSAKEIAKQISQNYVENAVKKPLKTSKSINTASSPQQNKTTVAGDETLDTKESKETTEPSKQLLRRVKSAPPRSTARAEVLNEATKISEDKPLLKSTSSILKLKDNENIKKVKQPTRPSIYDIVQGAIQKEVQDRDDRIQQIINYKNLPQWKRELLAEAPPINDTKVDAGMAVTISRVARRRELDKLVEANETDKTRMAKLERERRIASKWSVIMSVVMIGKSGMRSKGPTINPANQIKDKTA